MPFLGRHDNGQVMFGRIKSILYHGVFGEDGKTRESNGKWEDVVIWWCEELAQPGNKTHFTYVRKEVGRRKEEQRNNSIEQSGRNIANLQMWKRSVVGGQITERW